MPPTTATVFGERESVEEDGLLPRRSRSLFPPTPRDEREELEESELLFPFVVAELVLGGGGGGAPLTGAAWPVPGLGGGFGGGPLFLAARAGPDKAADDDVVDDCSGCF